MATRLNVFEGIVRRASQFTEASKSEAAHPFDLRNIHPDFPQTVRQLFDNGHCAQSTLEALKFIDEEIQRISGIPNYGSALMMSALSGNPPAVRLNPGMTPTEKSEQNGFKFLFAGTMQAIRNPRAHATGIIDDPDTCLDHLSLATMLLRRLDEQGLR